jgi:hypothetical protein
MADVLRVRNLATGCKLKLNKAKSLHEQCIIELNMQTMTFRNMSLAEMMQKRSIVAKQQETLAHAENPGLKVIWSTPQQQATQRLSYKLVAQANQLCLTHA